MRERFQNYVRLRRKQRSAPRQNLLPLSVPAVDRALAWSWLIEIGQGDFAAAHVAAEQALTEQRNADTVFARAVVHTLQGEFAAAFPLFEEAFATTQDPDCQFLIASVAHLAERQRGEILPDGVSLIFPEAYRRWGHYSSDSVWAQRWQELKKQVSDPYLQFEAVWLSKGRMMLPTYRAHILGVRDSVSPGDQQIISQGQATIRDLYETARTLQLAPFFGPLVATRLELIVLNDISQRAQGLDILTNMIAGHSKVNDIPGIAWLHLCKGDLLVTSISSGYPILFGYRLSESGSDKTTLEDSQLFDRSHVDRPGARAAYTEACHSFTQAGLKRGEAMTRMRLAYLDALEDKEDKEDKWKEAVQGYRMAQQQFDIAGDTLNAQAAVAGQLWVRWRQGEPGLDSEVRHLAQIAAANDALAWGLGWGQAFAYAGREALIMRGDVEAALSAATMAETLFEVFDSPRRCAQVCGDRSAALQTLEATEAITTELDKALGWLERAQGRWTNEEASISKTIGIQLTMSLFSSYSSCFDDKGLERTLARAHILFDRTPPVSRKEIEAMLKPVRLGLLAALNAFNTEKMQQKWQQTINNFVIHLTLRLLETGVAVYAPLSRGIQAMEAGKEEEAASHFQLALRVAATQSERDFLSAMIYTGWHHYSEARHALRQYIDAGMPQSTDELIAIRNEFGRALNPKGIPEVEQRERLRNLKQAGMLFIRMKAWEDARGQLDEIVKIAGPPQPLGILPTRPAIHERFEKGLLAEGLRDYELALHDFAEAATGLEAHRRYLRNETLRRALGGQRTTQDIYTCWARALANTGDWDEAFNVAERARARVLAEALGEAQAARKELQSDTVFRRYNAQAATVERLTSQLFLARNVAVPDPQREAALEAERNSAVAELVEQEAALFRAAPHWRELFAPQTEALSLTEVATRLPTGTLMLAYLFAHEHMLIWAITNAGLVGQYSITEFDGKPFLAGPFAAHTQEWVQQLDDGQRGMALAQVLLQPFDALIEQAEHLLIVPYAELNMFPFQALPWRGQPLGLRKVISYLPAASLLQYMRSSNPVIAGALVVGDPDDMWQPSDDGDGAHPLPPLPATRVEAQTVAAIYGARPLVGPQATKEIILDKIANNPKVIHFATHGYLQSKTPLASGIALAHRAALSVDEVTGLNIKADVVVLSACETGRGKLQGSELVGLARSLIYAGTRSAIVTLWLVNDLATALLMQSLHRYLHKDVPTAVALQRAIDDLYHTTVQQALDFCTVTLANFPRQSKAEQAAYATLTRRMGEVLAVGGDYARAIATYQQAITIFSAIGYTKEVDELEEIIPRYTRRASATNVLQSEQCVFNDPSYWAAFEVIGDWR